MRLSADYLARRYGDDVFRAALSVCRDPQEAQDAAQDAFVRYMRGDEEFASEEHMKAWLLRVAMNQAKNAMRAPWRRRREPLEDYLGQITFEDAQDLDLVKAVMDLPTKYRAPIHLFYYEGYSVAQIAQTL